MSPTGTGLHQPFVEDAEEDWSTSNGVVRSQNSGVQAHAEETIYDGILEDE